MQKDMHYYGTLAMAVAAGIPKEDAQTIAYASQFVDDSTGNDSEVHNDHGLLYAINTAHSHFQSLLDRIGAPPQEVTIEQRRTWVPFHYLPGGKGGVLSEKLICEKNGDIAKEMLKNNLEVSLKKPYGLELMGITAHAYMDTFSHYGFSGIASTYNHVIKDTISFIKEPENSAYITEKFKNFFERNIAGPAAYVWSKLGHTSVATYPDRPFLQYQFNFEKPRPDNNVTSERDNKADFLEGCKGLYDFFSKFAKAKYPQCRNFFLRLFRSKRAENCKYRKFKNIEATVKKLIANEAGMENRIQAWLDSGLIDGCEKYDSEKWEQEKKNFSHLETSEKGISTHAYRFHQAATFHRYYVLKDLLPAHNMAVF